MAPEPQIVLPCPLNICVCVYVCIYSVTFCYLFWNIILIEMILMINAV